VSSRTSARLIAVALALVVIVTTGALGYVIYSSNASGQRTQAIVEREVEQTKLYQQVRAESIAEGAALAAYYILPTQFILDRFELTSANAEAALAALVQDAAATEPEEVSLIQGLREAHAVLVSTYEEILELLEQGRQAEVLAFGAKVTAIATTISDDLKLAMEESEAELDQALAKQHAAQRLWNWLLGGIAAAWALTVVGAAAVAYFWVLRPVERERTALLEQSLVDEQQRARYDSLTGVLKHASAMDALRACIANRQLPVSLAMVDINGMKAINDTYGHQMGDAALLTLVAALGRDSVIVGRYGGDEFVAILPAADRPAAEAYRQAVIDTLATSRLTDAETGAGVPVTASIGLAVYPSEARTVEDLVRLADTAMYRWRRERAIEPGGLGPSRPLGDERAARVVGELVPLLTSPGDLDDKLRLVAHRLSLGAGYDAVHFSLFQDDAEGSVAASTFARLPDELIQAWNDDQRSYGGTHPLPKILEETRRPLILNDLLESEALSESQRALMHAAGMQSGLVAPMIWQDRVVGMLAVGSKREDAFGPRDAQFLSAVATQVTAIVHTATLVEDLQASTKQLVQAHAETVMMLASAAEAHDETTGCHLHNIRALVEALARELGYSEDAACEAGMAAVLHDIGKVRVPDSVLAHSGALTAEHWELMRSHAVWGEELLAGCEGFELAATVARCHHERWDGGGYPSGLAGEAIPEVATIVSVADSLDAMISDRPYRRGRPLEQAIAEVVAASGKQFSPKVVAALCRLYDRGAFPLATDEAGPERLAA